MLLLVLCMGMLNASLFIASYLASYLFIMSSIYALNMVSRLIQCTYDYIKQAPWELSACDPKSKFAHVQLGELLEKYYILDFTGLEFRLPFLFFFTQVSLCND